MKPASFIYSSLSNPKVILQSQNICGSGVKQDEERYETTLTQSFFLCFHFWAFKLSPHVLTSDPKYFFTMTYLLQKHSRRIQNSPGSISIHPIDAAESSAELLFVGRRMAADRQFSKRPKCPFPLKEVVLWHEARSSQEFGSEQFLFSSASF